MPITIICKYLICLAIIATALSACSTNKIVRGNLIRESVLAQIQIGTSTRQQVLNTLGSPTTSRSFDDNVWYYIGQRRERTAFYPSEIKAVDIYVLQFNGDILQSLNKYDQQSLRQVSYNEQRTPTRGSELTFLQQLFGNIGRFEGDPARGSVRDLVE